MNNELEQQLAEAVKKAIEVAEKTGSFVMDQAPELLSQFYTWQIWSNVFGIVLSIVMFLAGRYTPYLWLYREESYRDTKFFKKWGDEGGIVAWMVFICAIITSFILFFACLYEIVFITTAPELYLIKYFLK